MDWVTILASVLGGGGFVGVLTLYFQVILAKRKERRETAVAFTGWYFDAVHILTRLRFDTMAKSRGQTYLTNEERAAFVDRLFVHLTSGRMPALICVTYGLEHEINSDFGNMFRLLVHQGNVLQADPAHTQRFLDSDLPGRFPEMTFPTDPAERVILMDELTNQIVEPLKQELIKFFTRSTEISVIAGEWVGH